MGPHSTWFELFPGYQTLQENLQIYLGRRWTWQVFTATHFEISHILGGLLVFLLLAFFAIRYAASVRKSPDAGAVPPPHFCLRNLLELLGDMIYGLMEGPMGAKNARRYLPIIGSLFLFILFCNLLSLIPGFLPPTATLKTNVGLAAVGLLPDPRFWLARAWPQVPQALHGPGMVACASHAAHRADQPHCPAGVALGTSAGQHHRRPQGCGGVLCPAFRSWFRFPSS